MKKQCASMHNPFLIGTTVYLRPVEITDASIIQGWHNDPELRRLARSGELPVTQQKEEADIEAASDSQDEVYLMVVKKSDNKSIGFIRINGITSSTGDVWLRMIIGDKHAWGKQYAREALQNVLEWLFLERHIHRVTLETYATHRRAIRFFEKIGFQREGLRREAHFEGGSYHDIVCFGLLEHEFNKK
jgi:RimJ/RimL family protein N-acetyltransferase